jgi:hypothetical protein
MILFMVSPFKGTGGTAMDHAGQDWIPIRPDNAQEREWVPPRRLFHIRNKLGRQKWAALPGFGNIDWGECHPGHRYVGGRSKRFMPRKQNPPPGSVGSGLRVRMSTLALAGLEPGSHGQVNER